MITAAAALEGPPGAAARFDGGTKSATVAPNPTRSAVVAAMAQRLPEARAREAVGGSRKNLRLRAAVVFAKPAQACLDLAGDTPYSIVGKR